MKAKHGADRHLKVNDEVQANISVKIALKTRIAVQRLAAARGVSMNKLMHDIIIKELEAQQDDKI